MNTRYDRIKFDSPHYEAWYKAIIRQANLGTGEEEEEEEEDAEEEEGEDAAPEGDKYWPEAGNDESELDP